jgi:ABC-type branched-subunit amino acid transport system ATPase component/ABC-type branched-subunit amino acid transport system permease subunit
MLAFEVPLPVVVLGATIGMTYGLLSVGLVLVYRSNRIINFAHGEIGAFGAAIFSLVVVRWGVPYYLAVPLALGAAAGAAMLAEVAVVRRLRGAPPLMSIVATLGVGQFLLFTSAAINPQAFTGSLFPSPPGLPEFRLGALKVTQAYTGMLVFAPLVVLGLTLFLRRGRVGVGIRSSAANPEAARMAGIPALRMSSITWAIAGCLSAFTAMLVLPSGTFQGGESFGPSLLLRALTCAVVGRMRSLPTAFACGIGLGILEQIVLWNNPSSGVVDLLLLIVVTVALLAQREIGGRLADAGSWAALQGWRALPRKVAALPELRRLPWVLWVVAIAGAVGLSAVVTNSAAVILASVLCFAMVGMSISIVTGLSGQLSLGQFAVAGVGAAASYHVSSRTGSFPLSFAYAAGAGAITSLLIGLPALKMKGMLLTVTTLGFAVVTTVWLLPQSWMLGDGVEPGRPVIFGYALDSGRSYYLFTVGVFLVVALAVWNIRRSGLGRVLVAVRDNEDNARAFAIPARRVKLLGFMLAGAIAGVGGAAYGHLLPKVSAAAFLTRFSIDVVAMVVIGGTSLLIGPLLGAAYIVGVPAFLPLDSAGLAATQLGWLLLVLYLPGGIAQGIEPIRERVARWAARRHGMDLDDEQAAAPTGGAGPDLLQVAGRARPLAAPGQPVLEARGLAKHFGGVHAVTDVDLEVRSGEILGLIGPNGAGKTTTFEILSGFTRPDQGRVLLGGEDVSLLGPEARAQLGLVRSFQDAALFPTATVLECAALAYERHAPTSALRGLLGLGGQDRRKREAASELLASMGLTGYADRQIRELSTGTRRLVEIACVLALRPSVLLLDEPSSGIAQRETEALGGLLHRLRDDLGLTLVVIEHDIPLIMDLSDRIVAMDAGEVIAAGEPTAVRNDPLVVEAYLGGSIEALHRSSHGAKA